MKKPDDLRAVIFDLDGTLVDTADEFVVAVQALLAYHQRPAVDAQAIRASVSNGAASLVTLALGLPDSAPEFETERERLLEFYSAELGTNASLYPGLSTLLTALAERGIRWGIATNKPRRFTEPLLAKLALTPPPDSVVCSDDVAERKPHPESLYRNCRELDCAPHQAIYVGDHLRDIQAGRNAGMYTITAGYGYIHPDEDLDRWGASATVNCSTELMNLLLPT